MKNSIILFLIIINSCNSKNCDIQSKIYYDGKRIIVSYHNNGKKSYFLSRSQPHVQKKSDINQNPDIKLVRVHGYQNENIQNHLKLCYLIAQTKNGFGVSIKKDLAFNNSLPNDIYNRNTFILLPPLSTASYIYELDNYNSGNLLISNNHSNISTFSVSRRKAITDFYKIGKIDEFEPYTCEIKIDTITIYNNQIHK